MTAKLTTVVLSRRRLRHTYVVHTTGNKSGQRYGESEEKGRELATGQRRKAGLSQMDLANQLGFKYYTFISQIENGFGRVPSQSMGDWARALGVRPSQFARVLLGYYDPALFHVVFKDGKE